jgi:hypothetical protein
MFKYLRRWLDRRILRNSDVSAAQWAEAFAALPLLRGYSAEEKDRLRELAILFLHRKVFEGADGLVVSQAMTLIIALQACIPILELGLDCYDGWVSVIVYPAGFAPKRVIRDEYGVEHSVQSHLAGESWQRGPVVLAWDETAQAGVIDGRNLVIHEFAHKLDMQTGAANGFPPLHSGMSSALWFETFSSGFDDFQAKCARGVSMGIDCYAASSPAEFFAVFSEVFFERPDLLSQHYAAIYGLMQQYYRQDPLTRLG